jgi:hypothetical protein
MKTHDHTAAISRLEQWLAANGSSLKARAPKQHAEMKSLLLQLKKAPKGPPSTAVQKSLRTLFGLQLDEKRAGYAARLEALEARVAAQDTDAVKAKKALDEIIRVVDEAKKSLTNPAALKSLDTAASRARTRLLTLGDKKAETSSAKLEVFKAPLPGSKLAVAPLAQAASSKRRTK